MNARATTTLLLLLFVVACGRAPAAPATHAAGDVDIRSCGQQPAAQVADDGSLRGCFRVGELDPGRYRLSLTAAVIPRKTAGEPPSGVEIHLSPPEGPPGTEVTISGFLPGAAGSGNDPSHNSVTVCWDGCPDGLLHFETMRWAPDGHFTTRLRVPAAPWLKADGPHRPRAGTYRVGVQCIVARNRPPDACGHPDAEATFRLTRSAPDRCGANGRCARLEADRRAAEPGDVVRLSGFAPLVGVGTVLDVILRLEVAPDEGTRPAPGKSVVRFSLAETRFTARPGLRWHDVPARPTLLVQPGAGPGLTGDPADPRHLAVCGPGTIQLSDDGGATWRSVPTGPVAEAARAGGFPVTQDGSGADVRCAEALADPAGTVYGTFPAFPPGGPPPINLAGYLTRDGGRHWETVPVPAGSSPDAFGGFWSAGRTVLAEFHNEGASSADPSTGEPPPLVEATNDGARTWHPAGERCPGLGPCVTWGPEVSGNCAHTDVLRAVRFSADGGARWATPVEPAGVTVCSTSSLVSRPGKEALLLDGKENGGLAYDGYRLRRSVDGGATWRPVRLPPLPGPPPEEGATPTFPFLTALRDGSLLAFGPEPRLLPPEADGWCSLADSQLPDRNGLLSVQPVGDDLWWLDSGGGTHHVTQTRLRCR